MGYFTQLFFAAGLRSDTPSEVIDILKSLRDWTFEDKYAKSDLPDHRFFQECDVVYTLFGEAFYFSYSGNFFNLEYETISNSYRLLVVSACKNEMDYNDHGIEAFLDWIEPYIDLAPYGYNLYAVVTPGDKRPKYYYKNGESFRDEL